MRTALVLLLVLSGAGAAACTTIDLSKTLQVTDVQSGWYDNGVKEGKNHLVPQITFRLKNVSSEPINSVQLTVSYWKDGEDGMTDEVLLQGISSTELAPGASTEPIKARSPVGYTQEGARADLFTHSQFKDMTARIFAKRGGTLYRMGEFKIERKLIPTEQRDTPRP
ncbi:MAG TPA: hypothetical protein VES67_17280 [Vicinamibacterales bacterium]|nr:hypothetical protein [Vicinamibacterales bacterium]